MIIRVSCFGAGDESDMSKENMEKVFNEVEEYSNNSNDAKLFYWLGTGWRNYTSWHIRGDERKRYLEKSVNYFKKSFELAKEQLPVLLSLKQRSEFDNLDQLKIAEEVGTLLVNEFIIRNLEEAQALLDFIFVNTKEYEPCLCSYAELFYKKGEYEKCAEIARDLRNRIKNSSKWSGLIPPAPFGIEASAYRALGKKYKKDKQIEEAKKYFQKIIDLGIATENDKRILDKL